MSMGRQGEMETFVRVVEEGSLSGAARALGLTPSAVSKVLGRLEDRLGARLLNRTTRRIGLTEEGEAYHRRSVAILSEIDEAEQAVGNLHAAPRGRLKVNAATAFAQMWIVPMIPEFMARYPDVSVQLDLSDHIVDLVEEGADVAIRIAALTDSSLIARRLAPGNRSLCASPAYLEKHGVPQSVEDLKNHNCLTLNLSPKLNEWEFDCASEKRTVRVNGTFVANNILALHQAALAGIGIIRGSRFLVATDIKAGRLVPVLQDVHCPGDSAIHAVYPHSRHLSPKVRAFVDFLVERFTPVPPWEK